MLKSKETTEDEIQDIVTNLLACAANASDSELLDKQQAQDGSNTYEYFFNLSQVQMRKQLFQDSLKSLLKSFELAREDDSHLDHSEQTRFKVQELHLLNSFYHDLNQIEYDQFAKLSVSKTLKNEMLVEFNVNAF